MKRWIYLFISLQFLISTFFVTPQAFAADIQIYGKIGATEETAPPSVEPDSSTPTLAKPAQKYVQTTNLPKAGSVNNRMTDIGYGLLIVFLLLLTWKICHESRQKNSRFCVNKK